MRANRAPYYTRLAYVFWLLVGLLALVTVLRYPGAAAVYLLFTLTANALLYFGFNRRAIFFDTFIGVFFWLGFWLKLSVRIAFLDAQFIEPTGRFDGSAAAFDRALLVASCGFLGLLLASGLRTRYVFNYPEAARDTPQQGLLDFYRRNRRAVLLGFVFFAALIAATNFHFGIYQRGAIPRTVLPFGLSGVYSWLLLFGFASFAAVMLHFEMLLGRATPYLVTACALIEGFLSNLSLVSRGMLLNASALGWGVLRTQGLDAISRRPRFWAAALAAFAVLFVSSALLVNYLRVTTYVGLAEQEVAKAAPVKEARRTTRALALDRWVGIEGVMAVSSYPGLGWALWKEAWKETPGRKLSLYDSKLITSPYAELDPTEHNYISLPGSVAFFFYPGSFAFLFACMLALGALAAAIEISVFKLGGRNLVLCALLAQVIAYRYAHFGFAPRQSYLLFGALYLNLLLIYFADKALSRGSQRR
jgi:hypothetical protein